MNQRSAVIVTRTFYKLLLLFACQATLLCSIGNAQQLSPNGIGVYTEFNIDQYAFRLDLEFLSDDASLILSDDSQKRLSARVLAPSLTERQWSKFWIQNVSINTSAESLGQYADSLIEMTEAFKGSLIQGDLIEITRLASDDTGVAVNGVTILTVTNPGYFEFLATALLGGVPPSTQLKAALLKNGAIPGEMLDLFDSMESGPDRFAQIEAWLPAPEPEPEPEPEVVEKPATELADSGAAGAVVDTELTETGNTSSTELANSDSAAGVDAAVDGAADGAPTAGGIAPDEDENVSLAEGSALAEDSPIAEGSSIAEGSTVAEGSTLIESSTVVEGSANADSVGTDLPGDLESGLVESDLADATLTDDEDIALPEEPAEDEVEITAAMILQAQAYTQKVVGLIYQEIRYPDRELELDRTGKNRVIVRINRDGTLHSHEVIEEARYSAFDRATSSAVEKAFPVSELPEAIFEAPYEFVLPVNYQVGR